MVPPERRYASESIFCTADTGDQLGLRKMKNGKPFKHRAALLLAMGVALIQACFANELAWNQKARLAATFAFVEPGTSETGTFRIDNLYRNRERGLETSDWARSGKHFYPNKAPGSSMLGVPAYYLIYYSERLLGIEPKSKALLLQNAWLVNLWVSVLWNALAAGCLFAALTKIGQTSRDAIMGTLVYSFGTLVFPFSGSVWANTTAAAFLVISLLFWLFARTPSDYYLKAAWVSAACGFFAGAAFLTEYLAGVPFLLIGSTFLLNRARWRLIPYFTLGVSVPLGLLLLYQQINFGSFLTTAASLSNPDFLQQGKLAGQFGSLSFWVMGQLIFSLDRGLIPYMPIMVMCTIGTWRMIRGAHRELAWLCVAAIAAVMVVLSSLGGWSGGWSTGPRHLIIILPFLAFLLPPFSLLGRSLAIIYLVAGLISILNMWLIASYNVIIPHSVANPLYGLTYQQFWTGKVSVQALEMFFGWEGRWVVMALLGVFLIFAAVLLRIATTMEGDKDRTATPLRVDGCAPYGS